MASSDCLAILMSVSDMVDKYFFQFLPNPNRDFILCRLRQPGRQFKGNRFVDLPLLVARRSFCQNGRRNGVGMRSISVNLLYSIEVRRRLADALRPAGSRELV